MGLEGIQLGQYHLLRMLGSGGAGEVYLAEDTRIGQQVAIKVNRTEAIAYPNSNTQNDAVRLFQREAKAIAQLDHPHILPLYGYGEENSGGKTLIYIVMPFRREGTFADWLQQHGSAELLSVEDIAYFISQIADALQYAHSKGIIHQDVKPSNLLIRTNNENPDRPDLLLADFGIAKLSNASANMSQSIRGTPAYMAPEQWSGQPDFATDQYALAVLTYKLLTGRLPFQGNQQQLMYQHLQVRPEPPGTYNPRIPGNIDAVILRALGKKPEDRYPSISAFAQDLRQTLQGYSQQTIRSSSKERTGDTPTTLQSSSKERTGDTPTTLSSRQASILLYCIATVVLGFIAGIILNGLGKLPPLIVTTVSSLGAAIALISGILGAMIEKSFPRGIWKNANQPFAVIASLITVGLLTIPILLPRPPSIGTSNNGLSNPIYAGGTLVLDDPLSSNLKGFNWMEADNSCGFNGTAYLVNESRPPYYQPCFAQNTHFANFTYEVTLAILKGDCGAILFRANPYQYSYYFFRICQDGSYALKRYDGPGNSGRHITGQSSLIMTAPGASNVIAVKADGKHIDAYINNQLVTSMDDSIYTQGQIGVAADTDNSPTEVEFSNARVWQF